MNGEIDRDCFALARNDVIISVIARRASDEAIPGATGYSWPSRSLAST